MSDDKKPTPQEIFEQVFKYYKAGETDQAIALLKSIQREDNPELYATAQCSLGAIYGEQGDVEQAKEHYRNVDRNDSAEVYASAQLNLGGLYRGEGDDGQTERHYRNVKRSDDADTYAKAQYNLGLFYHKQGNFGQAKNHWLQVAHDDSAEDYAKAQFNLGAICFNQGRYKQAIDYFDNAASDEETSIYGDMQKSLVRVGLKLYVAEKIDDSKRWKLIDEAFEKISPAQVDDYWIQLINHIRQQPEKERRQPLIEMACCVYNITEQLAITSESDHSDEWGVAHYTNPSVAVELLSYQDQTDKEDQSDAVPASYLRLNPIDHMNDPTEGDVLAQRLGYTGKQGASSERPAATQAAPDEWRAFITCFSLHHDSLGQFRLYGKDQHREASGLSLVLKTDFFGDMFSGKTIDTSSGIDFAEQSVTGGRQRPERAAREPINDVPLYRCLYIDPKSELMRVRVRVAQRDEWTFYREGDRVRVVKKADDQGGKPRVRVEEPPERYRDYQERINQINADIEQRMEDLKACIDQCVQSQPDMVEQILLPLRYLVKHMAFYEERECRMVYLTQPDDARIQLDKASRRIYLDYERPVMKHLSRIYLGPQAEQDKAVFTHLCAKAPQDHKPKVESSDNPFRGADR